MIYNIRNLIIFLVRSLFSGSLRVEYYMTKREEKGVNPISSDILKPLMKNKE